MTSTSTTPVCTLCGESRRQYLFTLGKHAHSRCEGCGLVINESPEPPETPAQESAGTETVQQVIARLKQASIEPGAKILLIVPRPDHLLAKAAQLAGYDPDIQTPAFWKDRAQSANHYAGAILYQTMEFWPDPVHQLSRMWQSIKADGVLLVSFQTLDSWPVRLWKNRWIGWQAGKHLYYTRKTAPLTLLKSGFDRLWIESNWQHLSLRHIAERLQQSPGRGLLNRVVCSLLRTLSVLRRDAPMRLPTSGVLLTGQKGAAQRERPVVSIVVPVYNEKENFSKMMAGLLDKKLPGADREIILVESNSRDGTRELVMNYANHPDVRIHLQDRPRGKGNAVRDGFMMARGDILMIQDADMEYDFNDYDALLEPLLTWKELFVLGARHGGSWKMRQFNDQPVLSTMMNGGHCFFTGLINLLYGQKMKDPFTMFKVFRRDGLFGLNFKTNYFDFDHELVIKLVLKHYPPLEIPVNYRSRSYKEGKKVNLLREPFRWIRVDFSNRFRRLPVPRRGRII